MTLPSSMSLRMCPVCLCGCSYPFLRFLHLPTLIPHVAILSSPARRHLLASADCYFQHNHFFSTPLYSSALCALLCSAPFLSSPSGELLIILSSGHLSSVELLTCLTAPMTTICGNMAVTRCLASASERTCENTGICFLPKLLGLT